MIMDIEINEGDVRLLIPNECITSKYKASVFYNKEKTFKRDLFTLAFSILKPPTTADCFCGTGVIGCRFYKESPSNIFFVDLNPTALAYAKKNVELNNLSGFSIEKSDVNVFLSSHKLDCVILDPFGSPSHFIDSAFRSFRKKGYLFISATDYANLCGAKPKACLRHYDATPLDNFFCHETGLRILIGYVARRGADYDFSIKPLLSFKHAHYFAMLIEVEKSALKANDCIKKVGFADVEGKKIGKLWLGELNDWKFIDLMISKALEKGMKKQKEFLDLLKNEIGMPLFYYNIHDIASKSGGKSRKFNDFIQLIQEKGFKAFRTHFNSLGLKTNAPEKILIELMK
jgi:tRNA (guanine26-N2/guanine27-N2)-dimethyltransferase